MDRREFLRELEKLVRMDDLKKDDIRLYILLLTNCIGSQNAQIGYGTIRCALGVEFTTRKLKNACQRLISRRLITVASMVPQGTNNAGFNLHYTICSEVENRLNSRVRI